LEELTASVREKGIIQPIIVRPTSDDREFYEIVAGERRWRAAQRARLHEAPVVIKDLTDVEVLELAIIENIQRADLNALEEALGYAELIEAFHHTQEKLARIVGKSRSYIANSLRLLQLPMEVQTYLRDGRLTPGHARALITSENAAELAHIIVEKGLSVRDTERLAKSTAASSKPGHKTELKPEKDTDTLALEGDLSAALGMNVTIHHAGQKGGELRISYRTLEELDEVCRRLCTDTTYSNGDDF
jgi:ParB family chromosome partitioning protein